MASLSLKGKANANPRVTNPCHILTSPLASESRGQGCEFSVSPWPGTARQVMGPQEIFVGWIRKTSYLSLNMCLASINVCFYVCMYMHVYVCMYFHKTVNWEFLIFFSIPASEQPWYSRYSVDIGWMATWHVKNTLKWWTNRTSMVTWHQRCIFVAIMGQSAVGCGILP